MKTTKILGLLSLLLIVGTSTLSGWMTFSLDEPLNTLADNSAVDIVYDGTYVWFATGNGVSGTADGGQTWRSFNEQTGFTHSSIGALAALNGRLWAATAYEVQVTDESSDTYGGGLQFTDNFGSDWALSEPPQLTSRGKLAFDLSAFDSSLWAACWYGGLVRSLNRGQTWENVFIDADVEQDYEDHSLPQLERGRYFSTVVDPYHDDTVIVWAGSAEGVQRIYYIGKSKKLASNRINDVAHDSLFWWYATDRGLTRLEDTLLAEQLSTSFLTYDTSDGFPGNYISAVGARQELICAGIYDTLAQNSLGLMVSTDGGATWTLRTPLQTVGNNRLVEEVEVLDDVIWVACNEGGLIYSADGGQSWENLYFDSSSTELSDARNVVHCLDLVRGEEFSRLLAGTDSGAVGFYFSNPPAVDSAIYLEAWDNPAGGQRFVSITSILNEEYDQVWAAVLPKYFVGSDSASPSAVMKWLPEIAGQGVLPWEFHLNSDPALIPYDIEFFQLASTVTLFVANNFGLFSSIDFGASWNSAQFQDIVTGSHPIPGGAAILSVESGGGYLHAGSAAYGGARMYIPISIWFIFQAQLDPLQYDFVGRSYLLSEPETGQIGGNWNRALGLQRTGDSTIIWVGTIPVPYGRYGVSITSDRGQTWREVAEGLEVWNFAFNGDSVYLAASQGLFFSTDFGENWEELTIQDPTSGRSIDPNVWVLSARVVEGELWVGTNDGLARSSDGVDWEIFRSFYPVDENLPTEDRSYVSPVPFSPYFAEGNLKFHYMLQQGGETTISIYDFANNLVSVVTEGEMREAGEQYDDLDTWDGRNQRGDVVAGGVYIYLIESSGGDELWGKFMVLP
jgi:photosystem II stability/assembly factor-like uncharacterized protein